MIYTQNITKFVLFTDNKDDRRTPELMDAQRRLYEMLKGEAGGLREDNSRRRHADQYGDMSNDRIDRSPLNSDSAPINRELVSLSSEYYPPSNN